VITVPADAPSPRMDVATTPDVATPLDVAEQDASKPDASADDVPDPRDSPEVTGGCGCTTHSTSRPSFVFVFGLFVLIARRRRTH
jgi:MYXO-CTERM domain-containing protein